VSESPHDQRPRGQAGGDRLARGAQAAQTLSLALWDALADELGDELTDELGHERGRSHPARVAELAERLAEIARALAALARSERPAPVGAHAAQGAVGEGRWIAAIERRLERYERDRLPFAVLLAELVDLDRLRQAEAPEEVARLTGLAEAALSAQLGPGDALVRESPGRYWLLAPETDAAAAAALAERLAGAVRSAAGHRGVPLALAAGVAACPGDGVSAAQLASQAGVALYAARACGRPVAAGTDPTA
jgi:GGDEF domain-containing protein